MVSFIIGVVDPVPLKATSKLCQAVDVIRLVMEENSFSIRDGLIHKKAPEAVYTYIYCSTVKEYLLGLLEHVEIADVVAPHLMQITVLLRINALPQENASLR